MYKYDFLAAVPKALYCSCFCAHDTPVFSHFIFYPPIIFLNFAGLIEV